MPKANAIYETIINRTSDKEFENLLKQAHTWKELALLMGYKTASGGTINTIQRRAKRLNLDTSHFTSYSQHTNKHIPDEELFTKESNVAQTTVRRRMLQDETVPYRCAICDLGQIWNGKPLTLRLDHINGNNRDNRRENLRWVCPNCDSQLPTYSGKNAYRYKGKHKTVKPVKYFCSRCGKPLQSKPKKDTSYCSDCAKETKGIRTKRTFEYTRDELKDIVRNNPMTKAGKILNMSDNGVRKWLKVFNLPYKSSDIRSYTDEEWANL